MKKQTFLPYNFQILEITYNFQILGNNTMIIADYKDLKNYSFHLLVGKLWLLENDGLHTNHHLYSFKFIHSKV